MGAADANHCRVPPLLSAPFYIKRRGEGYLAGNSGVSVPNQEVRPASTESFSATDYQPKTRNYQARMTPVPDRFRGKVVLVTGSAHGIGKAIACRLAQEGADICIVDKDGPAAELTAETIRRSRVRCAAFDADISDRGKVEAVVEEAIREFGGIDVLINNAGMVVFGSLMECRPEDWNRMIEVDLSGAFHFTQIVGRHMIKRGKGGRMLHVGSTASLNPAPQQAAYSVAKAGLLMLSRIAALELASHDITSNLLCPHGAITDLNRELLSDVELMKAIEDKVPAHRLAKVEEIAAAAAFLVSDEAAYITGTELVHDGGASVSSLWWRQ